MQQLTTVNQKYVTQNDQPVNPHFQKCGRLLSQPHRIDAPAGGEGTGCPITPSRFGRLGFRLRPLKGLANPLHSYIPSSRYPPTPLMVAMQMRISLWCLCPVFCSRRKRQQLYQTVCTFYTNRHHIQCTHKTRRLYNRQTNVSYQNRPTANYTTHYTRTHSV